MNRSPAAADALGHQTWRCRPCSDDAALVGKVEVAAAAGLAAQGTTQHQVVLAGIHSLQGAEAATAADGLGNQAGTVVATGVEIGLIGDSDGTALLTARTRAAAEAHLALEGVDHAATTTDALHHECWSVFSFGEGTFTAVDGRDGTAAEVALGSCGASGAEVNARVGITEKGAATTTKGQQSDGCGTVAPGHNCAAVGEVDGATR